MEMGTVLLGYSTLEPVPVPEHTHFQIHTVLPVPVSCLREAMITPFSFFNSASKAFACVPSQVKHNK
jgi:hypothetical protein